MQEAQRIIRNKTTLSNHELYQLCDAASVPCVIIMRNELTPQLLREHNNFILNLESDVDGLGTHWTALHRRGRNLYYCDSFGTPMPQEQTDMAAREGFKVYHSMKQIQAIESQCCGFYCTLLHIWMNHGEGTARDRAHGGA